MGWSVTGGACGRGDNRAGQQAVAGVVIMVPFLIPGLSPFILTTIAKTKLPAANFDQPLPVLVAIAASVIGAVALGFF